MQRLFKIRKKKTNRKWRYNEEVMVTLSQTFFVPESIIFSKNLKQVFTTQNENCDKVSITFLYLIQLRCSSNQQFL